MTINKTFAAILLAVATTLSVLSASVSASENVNIVLTPRGKQAQAIREGLRIYGWANAARNTAKVDQRGRGNAAAVSQKGSGNFGAVVQRGSNNSATVAQNGNNNALAVFQVGRGRSVNANQTGNGQTGIVVQIGR